MSSGESSGYRPDLDGLRALAIIGVLVFHLDARYLPGGFLGVDVFFVLSGFLITSIMIGQLDAGHLDLVRFFERRIRRIYPAMLGVFIGTMVAGWFWLLPADWLFFNSSLVRAVCAVSNIYFEKHLSGYFSVNPAEVVLLHTWSLGVEMQFYALFPFLLLVLHRRGRSRLWLMTVTGLLLAGSWTICWQNGSVKPEACFFLLQYRAWQLLFGTIIALAPVHAAPLRWSHAMGVTGLGLITGSMIFVASDSLIPGITALFPCMGVGLLIMAGNHRGAWVNRLLAWRPLVFIGLISYSVYLWHWPVIVFGTNFAFEGIAAKAELILASLGCGWLSWRLIERPFRDPAFIGRRKLLITCALTGILLVGTGGYIFKKTDGARGRFSTKVQDYLSYKESNRALMAAWVEKARRTYDPWSEPVYGDATQVPSVALWGDSHAIALLPALGRLAQEHGVAMRVFAINGQIPVPGVVVREREDTEKIEKYEEQTVQILLNDKNLRTVILHARWGGYILDPHSRIHLNYAGLHFDGITERNAYIGDRLRGFVRQLLDAGKQVVIIYPVPEVAFDVPNFMARRAIMGNPVVTQVPFDFFYQKAGHVLEILDNLSADSHLLRVRPYEKLLNGNHLTLLFDNKPLYWDDHHLSEAGADYLREMLVPIFEKPMAGVGGAR